MSPRTLNLLTILLLLILLVGVSLTAPRWARFIRQPLQAAEEEPAAEPDTPASPGATAATTAPPRPSPEPSEAQRTISVKLFFEAADRPGLVVEDRLVPFSPDLSRQIVSVVEELLKGPRSGLVAPLNPATRVLEVFVSARGVAYVDLSKEVQATDVLGSAAERLAVFSIVNTIAENFPAVRRVQILVDDHPAETLAGHVDLSRPLSPDMTLLAALPVETPPPSPSSSAPGGTS
jgi:spore germination protein GerM